MNKKHLIDFADRVGATFLYTFLGGLTTATITGHASDKAVLISAAIAGGLSAAQYVRTRLSAYLKD